MNYQQKIEEHLHASGGYITAAFCKEHQIPTIYLSRMVRQGALSRVASGLYLASHGDHDGFFFFQYRYRQSIFSHETALYLLGATDRIIQSMDVTVSANYKFNAPMPDIRVHRVRKSWLHLGVTEATTAYGNPVRTYSYERTICDFIRQKADMDAEVYIDLMRSYRRYDKRQPRLLYEIAAQMNLLDEVRQVMELVYE
ncbi:MAG: type IV toxin-antitoxin system AbiEi family antitoxin domain-containing protein [Clostridiales bacterium]|nr:type IV toxin-antitoxin system AbiEi family antitoxin domain-containing protein [Clostridiales bacterium]